MPLCFRINAITAACALFLAGWAVASAAQPDTLRPAQAIPDTIAPVSAIIPPHSPLPAHGRMTQLPLRSTAVIGKRDVEMLPYFGFSEILRRKLPFVFPLFCGEGQFNSFAAFGGGARDVSVRFNGRALVSPSFGVLNPDQFPPEAAESFEVFTGTDAVVFGDNSSGLLLNAQEAIHDTKIPYTRLWYAQGEYDYIASDGIFSQNFVPDWNGTFGFRRQVSGGRFNNSAFDLWNVRLGLRYSPAADLTFTLTEIFTNHGRGTNGGLAGNTPSFTDALTATARVDDLDERVYRHDLTLAGSWRPDSSFAASGTAYFSHEDWEKNRDAAYFTSPSDTFRLAAWNAVAAGAGLRLEQKISDSLVLRAGGDLAWTNAGASVYAGALAGTALAGYAHAAWTPARGTSLRAGARLRIDQDRATLALGGAMSLQLFSDVQLTADVSRSDRTPSPAEGRALPSEKHLLALGGLRWGADSAGAELLLFSRYIDSPVESRRLTDSNGATLGTQAASGDSRTVVGGILTGRWLMAGGLFVQGWAQSYFSPDATASRLPALFAGASAQYEYRAGASRLVGGVSVAAMTSRRGETFVPQTWSFVPAEADTPAAADGLSVFLAAKLGNARLRVCYANLLSARYEPVPYYPELDRNIRITLSWAFND